MSSQPSLNHGGASILPSARRSIHSHDHGYCPFAHGEAMGRYGLKRRDLGTVPLHRGTDEVDNVVSKPLRPSRSPRSLKRCERRNSYTIDNSHELLSEDNVLSKSLPATFQTYYSDDNNDVVENIRQESFNGSHSTENSTHNRTPLLIQQNQYETEQSDISHTQPHTSSSAKHIMLLALLIGIIGFITAYYALDTKPNNVIYDKITFSTDLHFLGKKYNVGGDSILKVHSGIVTIIDREDTGSFIFVYNSKSRNFQENLFNNFMNDIASAAARLLRNDSGEVHHIVLESSHLKMRSHNEFMNTYRDEVDKTGVMLVKELENVPSNLAMAFHYYCDEYNPLVKKSAIFFTMDLGSCSTYKGQETSNAVIEKCLSSKWENVPAANIVPLLTRVVGVVVDVSRIF